MFQDTKQFKKLEKIVLNKLYFIKLLFETGYILKTIYLSSIFNFKIYNWNLVYIQKKCMNHLFTVK